MQKLYLSGDFFRALQDFQETPEYKGFVGIARVTKKKPLSNKTLTQILEMAVLAQGVHGVKNCADSFIHLLLLIFLTRCKLGYSGV